MNPGYHRARCESLDYHYTSVIHYEPQDSVFGSSAPISSLNFVPDLLTT